MRTNLLTFQQVDLNLLDGYLCGNNIPLAGCPLGCGRKLFLETEVEVDS